MRAYAVSAFGRDRPGIIAALSQRLLGYGLNIEESCLQVLHGQFVLLLVLSSEGEPPDLDRLAADLERERRDLGLAAIGVNEIGELSSAPEVSPTHRLVVDGADHPGIIAAFSSLLASHDATITDVATRLSGRAGAGHVYGMAMEVALPPDVLIDELEGMIETVGGALRAPVGLPKVGSPTVYFAGRLR